jgi:hypothetical protein
VRGGAGRTVRSGAGRSARSGGGRSACSARPGYSARSGGGGRSGRAAEVQDWLRSGLAGYGANLASEIAKASASLQASKAENDALDLTLSRLQHGLQPARNYAFAFE